MNRTTRFIAATFGIIFAISGISHGFFETLQGNTPTGGVIIDAISVSMRKWVSGGEGAFTLIPNFLITGIGAISVSIAIIIWSVWFLHTKHGATIFLLLFILLFLVGGGVAQIVFFTVGWALATRINKPLTWWKKVLPEGSREWLGKVWPWTLVVSSLLFFFALEIAIFGYVPGVDDANQLLGIIFASLGLGLIMFVLTAVSGFAYDIQQQTEPTLSPTVSARSVQHIS